MLIKIIILSLVLSACTATSDKCVVKQTFTEHEMCQEYF